MSLNPSPSLANLQHLEKEAHNAHEANFSLNYVNAARTAYANLYELMQQVMLADHEGILEVTLRTRSNSIVLPVNSTVASEIADLIQGQHADQLHTLQRHILDQLKEADKEQDDLNGTSPRAQAFALCMPHASANMKILPQTAVDSAAAMFPTQAGEGRTV